MKELCAQLTGAIERAVERGETLGANVLVLQHGQEAAYASAGLANPATGEAIRRDSIFRLYSQTKPITAAAIMLLVDRGQLDLSAFVSDFLPGFAHPMVRTAEGLRPAEREVAVFDLLSMTAGLSYPGEDADTAALFERQAQALRQGQPWDTVTFCNRMGQLPLAFEPGSAHRYSTCADVLGAIVEVVSGQRFGAFLEENFFAPLGMADTAFYVPPEKWERLVTCGVRTPGGIVPWTSTHLAVGDYTHAPAFESGGAGLVSTLDDYARFATMLLRGGELDGVRVLSRQAVARMTSPQLSRQILDSLWWGMWGYSYGHLMRICVDPGRCWSYARKGEYGWDGWLGTYFCNFPDLDVTFLLGQNMTDTGTSALARKCRNLVLAALGE